MMSLKVVRRLMLGLALLLVVSAGVNETASAKPKFSALAVDARTGDVLFASDADGLRHPASLTKVMTLYILFQELEAGHLTLDSELSISRNASGRPPTKLGLKPAQTIRTAREATIVAARQLCSKKPSDRSPLRRISTRTNTSNTRTPSNCVNAAVNRSSVMRPLK